MSEYGGEEKGAGVECHGGGQLFFGYDLRDDGAEGGAGKGADHAGAEDDAIGQPLEPMALKTSRDGSKRQRQQPAHAKQVEQGSAEQHRAFVAFVDDMSCGQRQAKSRDEFGEADEADGEGIMGDLVDAPADDGGDHAKGHNVEEAGQDKVSVFGDA